MLPWSWRNSCIPCVLSVIQKGYFQAPSAGWGVNTAESWKEAKEPVPEAPL